MIKPQILKKDQILTKGIGEAVAKRTILRAKDNGQLETWSEVASRVAHGNASLEPREDRQQKEYDALNFHINKATTLMSGRHLQHGDDSQKEKNGEIMTNCASSTSSFLMYLMLLNGSGVGRAYDDALMVVDWDNMPVIECVMKSTHVDFDYKTDVTPEQAKHKYYDSWSVFGEDGNLHYDPTANAKVFYFNVPDSREGWAKAIEIIESMAYRGIYANRRLILDFSEVRPKGAPIGGMQSRPSSGPKPMIHAISKMMSIKGAGMPRWRQAMFIDHYLAECVLVGGARRCLPKGTKVFTTKGTKNIEDITKGMLVYDETGGSHDVKEVFTQGRQLVSSLDTSIGPFDCTPNHVMFRWKTVTGELEEVKASALFPGDQLVFGLTPTEGVDTYYPKYTYDKHNHSTSSTDIIIPSFDEEQAWLLGYLHGDGCVDTNKKELAFTVHANDLDIKSKVMYELERFGIVVSVTLPAPTDTCFKLVVNSSQLAEFLSQYKLPNEELVIPALIENANQDIRGAYLAGLYDANGAIVYRSIKATTTIYPCFAEQINSLYRSLGIPSYVEECIPTSLKWKINYYVCIKGRFVQELFKARVSKFMVKSKSLRMNELDHAAFGLPSEMVKAQITNEQYTTHWEGESPSMNWSTLKGIVNVDHICPVTYYGVSDTYEEETFDLEVSTVHRFIANGFLTHNSARIATKHWSDPGALDFIHIKSTGELWSANNSLAVTKEFWKQSTPYARKILKEAVSAAYINETGEPGFINIDKLTQNEKGREEFLKNVKIGSERYKISAVGKTLIGETFLSSSTMVNPQTVNPCLAGDTLVAVADGRENISIKQLAEEGDDVPVYTLNDKQEVCVRVMRNPRITGKKKKLYNITLEGGHVIRATGNHPLLKRGDTMYTRVDALEVGDSLFVMNVLNPKQQSGSRGHQYRQINYTMKGKDSSILWEHEEIAKFHNEVSNLTGKHVHHANGNKTDNTPSNLIIEDDSTHLIAHSAEASNPNANSELLRHAVILVKSVGHRFSTRDWRAYAKTHNLPQHLAGWRKNHFNGIKGLSQQAALEAGLDPVLGSKKHDPRLLATYVKAVKMGYNSEIRDNKVYLLKKCEECGKDIATSWHNREVGLCGSTCANNRRHKNNPMTTDHLQDTEMQKQALTTRLNVLEIRKVKTREQQLSCFTKVRASLSRAPTRKEWAKQCKEDTVSSECGRPTSPFPKWPMLTKAAEGFNHRIIAIEESGFEEVYNGTVDDYHNFFVGGFNETTKGGSEKNVWVSGGNCGEASLWIGGAYCVLADIVPYHADTLDEAEDAFRVSTRALIRTNLMDFVYNDEVKRTNRIGVGITGLHEFAWKFFHIGFKDIIQMEQHDSATWDRIDADLKRRIQAFWETLDRFNNAVVEEATNYSRELGVTVPHTMTTAKPSGSVSKLFGLTEGVHLPAMREYVRWVQFRNDDPLLDQYSKKGYQLKKLKTYQGMTIVGFPTIPEICKLGLGNSLVTAPEATPEEQYTYLRLLERYWIHGTDPKTGKVRSPKKTKGNQISYCLAAGKQHLIPTSYGLQRIEDLVKSYTNDRDGGKQEIVALVDNGMRITKTMGLDCGIELEGTELHRVLTVSPIDMSFVWKHLKDVEIGDVVVRRVGDNLWSSDVYKLPELDSTRSDGRKGNTKLITTPKATSPEFCELLGMILSDGHIIENGIGLITTEDEIACRFESLIKTLFDGLECSRGADTRSKSIIHVEVNSRLLSRWMIKVDMCNNHDDHWVPECVLQSPKKCIEAFIRGYTLDGHVSQQKGVPYICSTVSSKMAKDLTSMLCNLGFNARIGKKKGRPFFFSESNKGLGQDQYTVSVPASQGQKFVNEIGFTQQWKNDLVAKTVSGMAHKMSAVPAEPLRAYFRENRSVFKHNQNYEKLQALMKAGSSRISIQTVKTYFSDVDSFKHLLDENYVFSVISTIQDNEYPVHTYDITVDVSHEYVANSIVVHNTLKYYMDKLSEEDLHVLIAEHQGTVACCSIMPSGKSEVYEYLPEQTVTKIEFENIMSQIRDDGNDMEEDVDKTHILCSGGSCPVDFHK